MTEQEQTDRLEELIRAGELTGNTRMLWAASEIRQLRAENERLLSRLHEASETRKTQLFEIRRLRKEAKP